MKYTLVAVPPAHNGNLLPQMFPGFQKLGLANEWDKVVAAGYGFAWDASWSSFRDLNFYIDWVVL